ncbi:MAG: hypothetical protein WAQ25_02370 [Candidatus Saccharimonas sp.]
MSLSEMPRYAIVPPNLVERTNPAQPTIDERLRTKRAAWQKLLGKLADLLGRLDDKLHPTKDDKGE